MDNPYILEETDDYAVVFKPPKMHCTSNPGKKSAGTLYDWFAENTSSFFDIMHRLDYETNGLVLFAKNEKCYNFLKSAQDNDAFIKEYSAICSFPSDISQNSGFSFLRAQNLTSRSLIGFPPCPLTEETANAFQSIKNNLIIESYFRPYGPGRKLVRPLLDDGKKHRETAKDKGGFYKTEIINKKENVLTARIKRGFRHQIRCHLYWIGYPILNDPLYSNNSPDPQSILALRSHALFFPDPSTGGQREYRIAPLAEDHSRLTAL
ncbi:MAG: RNA pseudouridine synthase [Treponema sp.]|jgi:23S rRNA pseudouridine1911/1915/1917 synthase|nr:RNA pseudouridine synthase [Treponema sp.]